MLYPIELYNQILSGFFAEGLQRYGKAGGRRNE